MKKSDKKIIIGVDKGSPDGDFTVKGYKDKKGKIYITETSRSSGIEDDFNFLETIIDIYVADKYSNIKSRGFSIVNKLKNQKEEIIEKIRKDRPIFVKNDITSLIKWQMNEEEILKIRKVLRIEILEDFGIDCSKMREELKINKFQW